MKNKKPQLLWLDQWGNRFWAATLKELKAQISGSVSKLYIDDVSGKAMHIGYVIGEHWLSAFEAKVFKERGV